MPSVPPVPALTDKVTEHCLHFLFWGFLWNLNQFFYFLYTFFLKTNHGGVGMRDGNDMETLILTFTKMIFSSYFVLKRKEAGEDTVHEICELEREMWEEAKRNHKGKVEDTKAAASLVFFTPGAWVCQPIFIACRCYFKWASQVGLSGKESACQCRTQEFDPWVRKIPGGGNGNPFQYSCLENPMDRGVWWAIVQGVTKSWAWLSNWPCLHTVLNTFAHSIPQTILKEENKIWWERVRGNVKQLLWGSAQTWAMEADWASLEKHDEEKQPRQKEEHGGGEETWRSLVSLRHLKGHHCAWNKVRRRSLWETGLERWQSLTLEGIIYFVKDLGFYTSWN